MFVPMNQFDIPDTVKHFRYPISNTETPYYYACWREKVLSGERKSGKCKPVSARITPTSFTFLKFSPFATI